jgi:hypothetical protein
MAADPQPDDNAPSAGATHERRWRFSCLIKNRSQLFLSMMPIRGAWTDGS